ncbi:TPA: hypothetical protein ACXIP1_000618 [Neisseria meningitidis]|nr:hypothetical protein [Neisseria meningitidis]
MGKVAATWKMPLPGPPPQERGRIAADLAVAGGLIAGQPAAQAGQ